MEVLIVLLVGVFCGLRYGATDLVAAVRGTDAWIEARSERARMRHELAMKRAERQRPTVGEAIAERIRTRSGAQQRRPDRPGRRRGPRGPFRRYLSELWQDTWAGAGEQRHRHAERKRSGDLPRQRAGRWIRDQATGRRPEPWNAERLDRDPPPDAEWTDLPPEAPRSAAPPPTDAPPRPSAPDTTAPTWAPVTPIRKDQPMTTASAEITSPETALALTDEVKADVARLLSKIETGQASLERLGVTGEPITVLGSMADPLRQLDGKADAAAGYFRQHISTADAVRADQSFGDKQYATGS